MPETKSIKLSDNQKDILKKMREGKKLTQSTNTYSCWIGGDKIQLPAITRLSKLKLIRRTRIVEDRYEFELTDIGLNMSL